MIYIGVDAHKSFSTFYGFAKPTGEIVLDEDKVPTQAEAFTQLFGGCRWEQAIATVEASNISCFVAEMLQPFVERVVIADPKVVRQLVRYSRPKTDKVDAQELAWQLSQGLIHEVYQHTPDNLAQRALTRGLGSVTSNGTRLRNQIRSLLGQFGLDCPYRDLCGKAARQWLHNVELREPAGTVLQAMTQALFDTQDQRQWLQKKVKATGRQQEQAQLLQTVPGIGPQTALTIVSEVGDMRRFPNHAAFVNFCGLAPSTKQSGNFRRSGNLVKGNKHLKRAFTQAANSVARQKGDTPLHQHYHRRLWSLGANQAKLDTARKIARITHAMLTRHEPYRYAN